MHANYFEIKTQRIGRKRRNCDRQASHLRIRNRVSEISRGDSGAFSDHLSSLPRMKESDIRKLASCAIIGTYPMGQVLFSEADHHNRVHLLCEGLVALEMRVPKHGVQRI